MKIRIILSVIVTGWAILFACIPQMPHASALESDGACSNVQLVFARGSGQALEASEYDRFRAQVIKHIDRSLLAVKSYELGTEPYDGFQYPAVDVADLSNGNAIGAKLSAGMANDYGESVTQGVNELHAYLSKRIIHCPNIKFILGGYSQGAQVIGQALIDMPEQVRPHIVFTGLFGDPKLYLPEGQGINPPACRGEDFSWWRRGIEECATDNGSLTARTPYLPLYAEQSTGLWCNARDFVCGSSKFLWDKEGHSEYATANGAIDQAAIEAAERLKLALPGDIQHAVAINQAHGSTQHGLDTVFFVDLNVSDTQRLEETKLAIRDALTKIDQAGGRMAITRYADTIFGSSYGIQMNDAETRYGFVTTVDKAMAPLETEQAWPLSSGVNFGYYIAFAETIDFLDWGSGHMKSVVLVTQRDISTTNPMFDDIKEYIRKRSLEIDPVNIYPVVPEEYAAGAAITADSTGGRVYTFNSTGAGSLSASIANVTTELIERPIVIFSNIEYLAKPGETVRFDVSDSYVVDSSIESYDWDFNGDGAWDQQTVEPYVEHVYETTHSSLVHSRAHAANGMTGTMTTSVHIRDADIRPIVTPPPVRDVVTTEQDATNEVTVSWERESHPSDQLISVNGVTIGRLAQDARSVTITDLDRTEEVTIGIRSVDESGAVSEEAGVVLAAIIIEEPTPEPVPPIASIDEPNTPPTGEAIARETTNKPKDNNRDHRVILSRASDALTYSFTSRSDPETDQQQQLTVSQPSATQNTKQEGETGNASAPTATPTWIAPVAIAVGATLALTGYRWIRKRRG